MRDRFTRKSKTERRRIRRSTKDEVLQRDEDTCQFCNRKMDSSNLTIDHLVPIARGGLDEISNYVTACEPCNQRKADMPLYEFARTIGIKVKELPVHGDPVIDNEDLPIQIRLVRKAIFDRVRAGKKRITGKTAQKKLEKAYRRAFWETDLGRRLEAEFPTLPGQVRIMIPEIQTIADSEEEYILLVELAKSAATRNLIGTILTAEKDVVEIVSSMKESFSDEQVRKRLLQAWSRYQREIRSRQTRQARDI